MLRQDPIFSLLFKFVYQKTDFRYSTVQEFRNSIVHKLGLSRATLEFNYRIFLWSFTIEKFGFERNLGPDKKFGTNLKFGSWQKIWVSNKFGSRKNLGPKQIWVPQQKMGSDYLKVQYYKKKLAAVPTRLPGPTLVPIDQNCHIPTQAKITQQNPVLDRHFDWSVTHPLPQHTFSNNIQIPKKHIFAT